jgi:hypothetical protein
MRVFSPTGFAAILLFFALPFGAVVDCDGTRYFDWTGVELLTASVDAPPASADDAAEVEDRWILAWPVFLSAVAGLVLGVFWRARYAGWAAVAGLAATCALVAVPEPVLNEQPEWGLLLVWLTFAALTLVHGIAGGVRLWRRRQRGERHEPPLEAFR